MAEKRNIPHLMDEPPISVYPSLAKALGNVNKAIMLQQLHFLLNVAKQSKNAYVNVDGKWWVYNSYEQWQEYFPWLSTSTIKGLFGMLEHDGLVVSRQGVKNGFDRRKWYTLDYNAYLTYVQSIGQNLSDVETEIVQSDGQDLPLLLSETTPETTTENKEPAPKRDGYPKRLSDWKQKDMDRYYSEHGTDLDVLVMAWGSNGRFKDETLTERRLFVQCYTELSDIGFPVENYVSLASYTRANLVWRGKGIKPTVMLEMVGEWRNSRLDTPKEIKSDEPKAAHEMTSYELQIAQHNGAEFEWQ